MKTTKNQSLLSSFPWVLVLGIGALILICYFAYYVIPRTPLEKESSYHLSAQVLNAYNEAMATASSDPAGAISRIDEELDAASGDSSENLYTRAKLSIYKADILLGYAQQFKEGFDLLGAVYTNGDNTNDIRGEALMLAMARGIQSLDEGLLSVTEVRDYLLLNPSFASTIGIGLAGAMLIDAPQDTYEYLARGFARAADLSQSERVDMLARSYSLRLLSPFIFPPTTGEVYNNFVGAVESKETELDILADSFFSSNQAYQEFIPASYYNLARTYEGLLSNGENTASMIRVRGKLTTYIDGYPGSSDAAEAYKIALDTRIICKAIDEAGFDASEIDQEEIQPYLDELYESEGWVVPCKEAFEFVADKIDSRFAKYF